MNREEAIKKFEFDIRFKYSPVIFRVTNQDILELLYDITINILNLRTNSAYVEYLLDNKYGNIDCVFLIDLDSNYSDVFSYSHYLGRKARQSNLLDYQEIPGYIKDI